MDDGGAADSVTTYLVHLADGSELGPASLDDLRAWVQAGVVKQTTSIQVVGTDKRVPAAIVSGLFEPVSASAQDQSVAPALDSSPQISKLGQYDEEIHAYPLDESDQEAEQEYTGPWPVEPGPARSRKLRKLAKWGAGIGLCAMAAWVIVTRLAPSRTDNVLALPVPETPNIVLGITIVPIDDSASDAYGIPRGQGWLVFDVRGRKPNVRIPETGSVSEQMRLANEAAKLVEEDALSGRSKWSVHGELGRLQVTDMILWVDGQKVGPSVNDGSNMVGRALAGRPQGYRYKIEGLRLTSQALAPETFEAWFVVPP